MSDILQDDSLVIYKVKSSYKHGSARPSFLRYRVLKIFKKSPFLLISVILLYLFLWNLVHTFYLSRGIFWCITCFFILISGIRAGIALGTFEKKKGTLLLFLKIKIIFGILFPCWANVVSWVFGAWRTVFV